MGASEPISQLRTLSPERVFAGMVELLRGRMGADVVWMQYEGRDGRVRLLQSPDVFDSPPLEWPRSACRAALRLESAVFEKHIDVAKVVPTRTPLFLSLLVCNPLALNVGRIVLSVGWHQERVLTPQDRELIDMCTRLGGAVMENAAYYGELSSLYAGMIRGFVSALEMRDFETVAHSRRVVTYTLLLAERMGVAEGFFHEFSLGAALHDVGKIAISDLILRKPGKLTKTEYALVQQHPVIGCDMLRGTLAPYPIALEMVRHHHERYDGAGYPDRLAGSDIPFAARLLALADAFDVMTNDRPYSRARSVEEARREVAAHRGTQFCPQCVDAFMSIEPSALEAVRRGELDRSLIFDDPDLQPGGLLKRQDSLPAVDITE